jgi:hypothetical protein
MADRKGNRTEGDSGNQNVEHSAEHPEGKMEGSDTR